MLQLEKCVHVPAVRRFPPPWTAKETDACFIVKAPARYALAVAYVYFEDEPGRLGAAANLLTRDQAKRHRREHRPNCRSWYAKP